MTGDGRPFWEKTYRDAAVASFGRGPTRDVAALWERFPSGGAVLDVGCGEGRNALFLAGKGFTVDAFDITEAGVEKTRRLAAEAGVSLNAWTQDLTRFTFTRPYDVILSHGVLHLVEREQWLAFIGAMQQHTKPGGLNLVGIFTNRLPAAPDMAAVTKALFEPDDLEKLYADWEILLSDDYEFRDEHPGGIKHHHAAANVAARKPG